MDIKAPSMRMTSDKFSAEQVVGMLRTIRDIAGVSATGDLSEDLSICKVYLLKGDEERAVALISELCIREAGGINMSIVPPVLLHESYANIVAGKGDGCLVPGERRRRCRRVGKSDRRTPGTDRRRTA